MDSTKFNDKVQSVIKEPLTAQGVQILQVNLGYRCNMACTHCHVSAGPARSESMPRETVEEVLRVLSDNPIETLDITGGAPELHPHFQMLVTRAKMAGKKVIVRTNLSVLLEKGQEGLPEFYRDHGVDLVASLPCYREENVDAVRGSGAFNKSIRALRVLNRVGFGIGPDGRSITLVYNPRGAFLAPAQRALEADYKRELMCRHQVTFNRLFAFTNMPVGRFREALIRNDNLEIYQEMLASAFNPATLETVMCRSLVSIGWDGRLYDCDFNQALGLGVDRGVPTHISDFDHAALSRRTISVDDHCFGCTAGQGSSCSGAMTLHMAAC
ncbi:MAG: arsenosugar biosynthesis radical SAM protein ArsS [Nitrospirae bacterium]|nr:arsenosugar biosynthesis radical SAM protein ArsS [Nitrospirota bacterium]